MPGPLTASLSAREVIASGIADLAFKMESPDRLQFRAGQFVSLALPTGATADAASSVPRRSYSIASQSDAGDVLRFIIRVIPEGKASDFLMAMPIGTRVNMTGPHGFFVLDAVHPGDIVFAATGTGIAAVMPMLGELARRPREERRKVVIFWGMRQASDIFARREIEGLAGGVAADLAIHLSAPESDWTGLRGRITPALLERLPHLVSPTFYLVGNGAMITELKRELISRGVNRKTQIRTEAFFD